MKLSLPAILCLAGCWTFCAMSCSQSNTHPPPDPARGVLLEDLTWQEAEKRLTPEAVVVIPIGAALKEHGPHLKLKNDWILAEYFKQRVLQKADVVMAPSVGHHYYPAFLEYPGSVSLRLETARDLMVDICRSLKAYGPRRFYALNTGVSTRKALGPAASLLAAEGVLLHYTDLEKVRGSLKENILQQEGGSHADEVETSMLLYIDPASVDMSKAVKDYDPNGIGGLTRKPGGPATYSPTGIWGDPTLATREKGEKLVEAMVIGLLADIEALRTAPLPAQPAPPE
jgi:creatinine amidohydrolase